MAEVRYSTGVDLPYCLERDRANLITCPTYASGAAAAPTQSGSTCTVYDASGAVVSTGAVTVASSVATYTVAAQSSLSFAEGWSVVWRLVMPDGVTHTFRFGAALVLVNPSPAVSDADLFKRNRALDPAATGGKITSKHANFQGFIDMAWVDIQRRMIAQGRRPWRILDQTDLFEPHLLLTLALIYEDLASMAPGYLSNSAEYRRQFAEAWGRVSVVYDSTHNHTPSSKRAGPRSGMYWLCGGG